MRCSSRKKIKECKMKEAKLIYLKNFQTWKKIYKIIVFSRKKRVFIVTENRFRTVCYDIKDAWVWRRWYFLKAVSLLGKSKEQAVWSFLSCRRKERERNVNFHAGKFSSVTCATHFGITRAESLFFQVIIINITSTIPTS